MASLTPRSRALAHEQKFRAASRIQGSLRARRACLELEQRYEAGHTDPVERVAKLLRAHAAEGGAGSAGGAAGFAALGDVLEKSVVEELDRVVAAHSGFCCDECVVRGHPLALYRSQSGQLDWQQLASGTAGEGQLLVEAAGLVLHRASHRLLARPLHHCWHLGERAAQQEREVDEVLLKADAPQPLLELLPGLGVHAFCLDGRVHLASRSGRPKVVLRAELELHAADAAGEAWRLLVGAAIDGGYTPLLQYLPESGAESAFCLVALRHRASGRYVPYASLQEMSRAFGTPLVPCLATWSPAPALSKLARLEPRRALDEAVTELRKLLKHTAPARGGALQGCLLFLPSGLTLRVTTMPPSKLSVQLADEAEVVEVAPSPRALQLVGAAQVLITCAFDVAARSLGKAALVGPWSGGDARASVAEALRCTLGAAERRGHDPFEVRPGSAQAWLRKEGMRARAEATPHTPQARPLFTAHRPSPRRRWRPRWPS